MDYSIFKNVQNFQKDIYISSLILFTSGLLHHIGYFETDAKKLLF